MRWKKASLRTPKQQNEFSPTMRIKKWRKITSPSQVFQLITRISSKVTPAPSAMPCISWILRSSNSRMGGRYCSSYICLQRAQQLFCGKTGLTVNDAQAALRDHKGYPTSICDHSSEHLPIEIADCATNFGLVMNLTDNEVWLVPGNPCENPFAKILL